MWSNDSWNLCWIYNWSCILSERSLCFSGRYLSNIYRFVFSDVSVLIYGRLTLYILRFNRISRSICILIRIYWSFRRVLCYIFFKNSYYFLKDIFLLYFDFCSYRNILFCNFCMKRIRRFTCISKSILSIEQSFCTLS